MHNITIFNHDDDGNDDDNDDDDDIKIMMMILRKLAKVHLNRFKL